MRNKNKIYRIKEDEDPKSALSKNARVLERERNLSSLKKLQSLATILSIITVVGGIGGSAFSFYEYSGRHWNFGQCCFYVSLSMETRILFSV